MSYLAVHINPEDFALPAFFGLAYPYLLLINIILAVIWAMLLKFEAIISIIVIAIGFTHFTNFIKLSKSEGDNTNTIKVLSYNIHLFNYFEDNNSAISEKKIVEFIKSQEPDILCLQEFFALGNSVQKELEFKKALGGKYYSHLKVLTRGKNRFFGIATFSKYPIIKKGEIIHPNSSSLSIYTDILIQKDTFRIYNNHLLSFRLKRMDQSFIDKITTSDDGQTMEDVKSLSLSLKKGFVQRSKQSQVVKNHINKSPFPVIVTGDFNDTPVSYSYRKIRKGLFDSFVQSGYGAGFTYKGNYPPNRIDYILYDNALASTNFEIIKLRYSDHYPIISYLRKNN
jgi:endonuclease/exonuclease/phosphatase family metal-dependent hydrolase